MPYNLYPAIDETYNFPPEVRRALSVAPELRNSITPLSNSERDNLPPAELWNGRVIANTTTNRLERYNGPTSLWDPIASDHIYATPAERDASLPSPSDGDTCYVISVKQHQGYHSAAGWYPIGGAIPTALLKFGAITDLVLGTSGTRIAMEPSSKQIVGGFVWDSTNHLLKVPKGVYNVSGHVSFSGNSNPTNNYNAGIGTKNGNLFWGSTVHGTAGRSHVSSIITSTGEGDSATLSLWYFNTDNTMEIAESFLAIAWAGSYLP
jgi:hypothetical protein